MKNLPNAAGNNQSLKIGVLALQGCVEPHLPHVEAAGAEFLRVKTAEQLNEIDGLILPGGESTTMLKLINRFEMFEPLQQFFKCNPAWGICAGAILMAQKVSNPEQQSFGIIPMGVERNGYGRQLDSMHQNIQNYPVSFIRAPVITECDKAVEIVASFDDLPVWVRYNNHMAMAFHPELTLDFPSPMHQTFIELVQSSLEKSKSSAA